MQSENKREQVTSTEQQHQGSSCEQRAASVLLHLQACLSSTTKPEARERSGARAMKSITEDSFTFDACDIDDIADTGLSSPALPGRSFPAKCGEPNDEPGDGDILLSASGLPMSRISSIMFEDKLG
jgi:hypothetical protein